MKTLYAQACLDGTVALAEKELPAPGPDHDRRRHQLDGGLITIEIPGSNT